MKTKITTSALPNWNLVKDHLNDLESIAEKIDYLDELNQEVTGPLMNERQELWNLKMKTKDINPEQERRLDTLDACLFPGDESSSLLFNVPIHIINDLKKEYEDNPDFALGMLKSNAKRYFAAYLDQPHFKEDMSSPLALKHIKVLIDRLESFENKSISLLEKGKVNIHMNALTPGYYSEIEYLRLVGDYYKHHKVIGWDAFGTETERLYCDHWLLKPYLEDLKNELESSNREDELLNGLIEDSVEIARDSIQSIDSEKEQSKPMTMKDILSSSNQFIVGMSMQVPYDHFVKFVENNSENKLPYLNEDQFHKFLRKGFLGDKNVEMLHINHGGRENGYVIKRFHQFFVKAADQYHEPSRTSKHIDLILHCFDNWDRKTIENFFKPNKVKKEW